MRNICLFLLVALLGSEHALGLTCYICSDVENHDQCMPSPSHHSICFSAKMTTNLPQGNKITVPSKGCAPSCEAVQKLPGTAGSGTIMEGLDYLNPQMVEMEDVSCCDKDFCNGAAVEEGGLGVLAAGLMLSLLWALL
nr:lymphocyte antigen 6H-like [Castor canadensis]